MKVLRELKDDAFAVTRLVEVDGRRWLLKEYRFRTPLGRWLAPLARRQAQHEMAVGRLLQGLEGVPGEPVRVSDTSFRRPWIDGEDLRVHLRRGGSLPDDFFDRLEALVREIHARGVAYADLQKKDNVIVGRDGRPWLIDFQISLRPRDGGALRRLRRWWLRHTQSDDLRHVYKHKRRIRPDLLTPEEDAASRRRSPVSWLKRVFYALTLRRVKRWIYPHGSDDTFRFSKAWRDRDATPRRRPPGPPG
ncbi:MAG: hypothetical protein ACQGVC_24165 [Myxococcota bacterium]